MKKSIYLLFACIVIAVAVIYVALSLASKEASIITNTTTEASPKNTSYKIEGAVVALQNGIAEEVISDSSAKKTTRLFDATTTGDVNGDGLEDTVVILTQTTGGSGTYYYVAVAMKTEEGYQGTNALLLGDRIAPQTTEIRNGWVIANYADRNEGEPMTAQPSLGLSMYARMVDSVLTQVPTNNAMIHVTSTTAFQTVASPLTVSGEARGNWYFEASFPVQVLDMNNNVLVATPAQAQGDWMTTNFVPFSATLTFTAVSGQPGMIVFKKDNPSGLPQNDASISIPVIFQ